MALSCHFIREHLDYRNRADVQSTFVYLKHTESIKPGWEHSVVNGSCKEQWTGCNHRKNYSAADSRHHWVEIHLKDPNGNNNNVLHNFSRGRAKGFKMCCVASTVIAGSYYGTIKVSPWSKRN